MGKNLYKWLLHDIQAGFEQDVEERVTVSVRGTPSISTWDIIVSESEKATSRGDAKVKVRILDSESQSQPKRQAAG